MERYARLMIPVGVVAEWGHAGVRLGHVLAGDNPTADVVLPALMLGYGVILAAVGLRRRR